MLNNFTPESKTITGFERLLEVSLLGSGRSSSQVVIWSILHAAIGMTINILSFVCLHHHLTKVTLTFNIFSGEKLPGHPFLSSTHFLAIFIQVNSDFLILASHFPFHLKIQFLNTGFIHLQCAHFRLSSNNYFYFLKESHFFFWSSNPQS